MTFFIYTKQFPNIHIRQFQNKINLLKPTYCILISATLLMMSVTITSQDVFATHLSEEIRWQLIFISSQGCSLFNYEKMNQYHEITENYLEMYGMDTSKYDPTCMPESEYLSANTGHLLGVFGIQTRTGKYHQIGGSRA